MINNVTESTYLVVFWKVSVNMLRKILSGIFVWKYQGATWLMFRHLGVQGSWNFPVYLRIIARFCVWPRIWRHWVSCVRYRVITTRIRWWDTIIDWWRKLNCRPSHLCRSQRLLIRWHGADCFPWILRVFSIHLFFLYRRFSIVRVTINRESSLGLNIYTGRRDICISNDHEFWKHADFS